jgi:hypothetical protein
MSDNLSLIDTLQRASLGGFSSGISSAILNPIDVTKIRLQNQTCGMVMEGIPQYSGLVDGLGKIFRAEGIRGLLRGMEPSMYREMTYSSCRMGAYEPIRGVVLSLTSNKNVSKEDVPIYVKYVSGMLSGGIGSAICNPFDLVKTRFQAEFPKQKPLPYDNTFQAFKYIYKFEGGFNGLYKAWQMTCGRAAFLTSGQLGSYDTIKNNLLIQKFGMNEKKNGFLLHIVSAMSASIVATTAANPCDVIKSRYMSDGMEGRPKIYKSVTHCISKTFRVDGIKGFLKGWTASYWRIGPHTIISLILFEKTRNIFGFKSI